MLDCRHCIRRVGGDIFLQKKRSGLSSAPVEIKSQSYEDCNLVSFFLNEKYLKKARTLYAGFSLTFLLFIPLLLVPCGFLDTKKVQDACDFGGLFRPPSGKRKALKVLGEDVDFERRPEVLAHVKSEILSLDEKGCAVLVLQPCVIKNVAALPFVFSLPNAFVVQPEGDFQFFSSTTLVKILLHSATISSISGENSTGASSKVFELVMECFPSSSS